MFLASVWRVQYSPKLVQRCRSEDFDQTGTHKSDNYLGTIGCGHLHVSLVLALYMDECNETTMGCPNSELVLSTVYSTTSDNMCLGNLTSAANPLEYLLVNHLLVARSLKRLAADCDWVHCGWLVSQGRSPASISESHFVGRFHT